MAYEFTLKFRMDGHADRDDVVEKLGAAGCDDAIIGTGIPGRLALSFDRTAPSARAALLSAVGDVRKALPDIELLEVAPDFVGLSDVAEHIGVSRQNMRKLMLSHAHSFPLPVHDGTTRIWHFAEVLRWLGTEAGYAIPPALLDTATVAMQINATRAVAHLPDDLRQELRAVAG